MLLNLVKREDFDLDSAYTTLGGGHYVSHQGLKTFFTRNGFYSTTSDLLAILMRLDLNYDEAISRDELSKCLLFYTPTQEGSLHTARLSSRSNTMGLGSQRSLHSMKENYYSLGKDPS